MKTLLIIILLGAMLSTHAQSDWSNQNGLDPSWATFGCVPSIIEGGQFNGTAQQVTSGTQCYLRTNTVLPQSGGVHVIKLTYAASNPVTLVLNTTRSCGYVIATLPATFNPCVGSTTPRTVSFLVYARSLLHYTLYNRLCSPGWLQIDDVSFDQHSTDRPDEVVVIDDRRVPDLVNGKEVSGLKAVRTGDRVPNGYRVVIGTGVYNFIIKEDQQ